jgi:predicted Zn finger-like uncharacterized protein
LLFALADTPMLIVCPNCATSYGVEMASLRPVRGLTRKLRCRRCRWVWQAQLSDTDKLLVAAEAVPPDDAPWPLSRRRRPMQRVRRCRGLTGQRQFWPTSWKPPVPGPMVRPCGLRSFMPRQRALSRTGDSRCQAPVPALEPVLAFVLVAGLVANLFAILAAVVVAVAPVTLTLAVRHRRTGAHRRGDYR